MAQCFHPFFVDAPSGHRYEKQPVPCGKCPPCLQREASAWAFRMYQELNVSPRAYFVTLTYDRPPYTDADNFIPTLVKRDWQLFMKRVRKFDGRTDLKYFAVGEYGARRFRPHYHAIMYDVSPDAILSSWKGSSYEGVPGIMDIDPDVNLANIAYVTKYITKGRIVPSFDGDPRLAEFRLMSKGLGLSYLSSAMVRYHKADLTRCYHTLDNGVKIPMARYYKERIYSPEEREFILFQNSDEFRIRFEKDKAEWLSSHDADQRHILREFPGVSPDLAFERAFVEAQRQAESLFFKKAQLLRADL